MKCHSLVVMDLITDADVAAAEIRMVMEIEEDGNNNNSNTSRDNNNSNTNSDNSISTTRPSSPGKRAMAMGRRQLFQPICHTTHRAICINRRTLITINLTIILPNLIMALALVSTAIKRGTLTP